LAGQALHLNLDDAWRDGPLGMPEIDARDWGPRLRFSAPAAVANEFYREHQTNLGSPFLLYGSGDFHYLTALRLRRIAAPLVLVSFDNHPDWDVRPPTWGCGGWVNRALELANVNRAIIWGCGNFECWWPHQIFGNRRAERAGMLTVHPWADNRPAKDQERPGAILRGNWRQHFEQFLRTIDGENVYVTIDVDCLNANEAVTNWEPGRFTAEDLQWALKRLRESSQIVGGDVCGAYSPPAYARYKQRFAAEFDHPRIQLPDPERIRQINLATLEKVWPQLSRG